MHFPKFAQIHQRLCRISRIKYALIGMFSLLLVGLLWLLHDLPSLAVLDDLQPKLPLRVFSQDGILIGEFGQERRKPFRLQDAPAHLRHAVLDIEDARFYEHGAIDLQGILRAGLSNLGQGGKGQGASTLSMQVARDIFLSREKTYTRKLREIALAYKLEWVKTKDEILELYLNQVYLGQRAYGFASAAQTYFGKDIHALSVAEAAMLAGLPKAPSAYNPVVNPKRARQRQVYILKRMLELGHLDQAGYTTALQEPLQLAQHGNADKPASAHAEYVAEMVRAQLFERFGEAAYSRGYQVTTTLDYDKQQAAWAAVQESLLDYDKRRGWRGPEGHIQLEDDEQERDEAIALALSKHPDAEQQQAVVVLNANSRKLKAQNRDGETIEISAAGLRFAQAGLAGGNSQLRIRSGSIIRVQQSENGRWEVVQQPQLQGALVALSPQDGAILALVGGFDFRTQPFNRVSQAMRQAGSTFKPFVYSAALEKGLAPATLVNDAPFTVPLDKKLGSSWTAKNDDGYSSGPLSLRKGLQKSKNQVAVRVLDYIGVDYARSYVQRFGIKPEQTPAYLSMILGAGQLTPLQLATGYAVFANGGWQVTPYLIKELRDSQGRVLERAQPAIAEKNARRVLSTGNAFIMHNLLNGVAMHGSAWQSNQLGRTDLGGKTGTTNEGRDAWFAGYQRELVAISWLGFDQPKPIGSGGAQLALPMWNRFMAKALRGIAPYTPTPPADVVQIGGEWYLQQFTPEHGFIAQIGMEGLSWPLPEEEVEAEEGDLTEAEEAPEADTPPVEESNSGL